MKFTFNQFGVRSLITVSFLTTFYISIMICITSQFYPNITYQTLAQSDTYEGESNENLKFVIKN